MGVEAEGAAAALGAVYLPAVDALVGAIAGQLEELRPLQLERGAAMVSCYPGGGAAYVRHCDNPNANGRRLTAIYYLNAGWVERDGGALRLYAGPRDQGGGHVVEPLADRLVVFFSDQRVPHEVTPTRSPRYAVTTWYMCARERVRAAAAKGEPAAAAERAKLIQERDKFARDSAGQDGGGEAGGGGGQGESGGGGGGGQQ